MSISLEKVTVAKKLYRLLVIVSIIVSLVSIVFVIVSKSGNETERLYWKSIKEKPTNALYCEYLEKYPIGEFKETATDQLQGHSCAAELELPVGDWKIINRYQIKDRLVKDTTTDLMWQRCSLGQIWKDASCQGTAEAYTWEDAMKVANNYAYAGYKDWRLPTIDELKTLVYCSSGLIKSYKNGRSHCDGKYTIPTINDDVFLNTPRYGWYWSSTPNAERRNTAWVVSFSDGGVYADGDEDKGFNVRLVRNGQ